MMDETKQAEKVKVVQMTFKHLDEVLIIEQDSFPSPWSREGFRQEIINRNRSISLTALIEDLVVGYSVAWFVVDEFYIGNIAVHSEHRRKGIGEMLLRTLLHQGFDKGCQLATLEVRQTNRPAIQLYQKLGFRAVAVRKGYYTDTGENAIVMLRNLKQENQTFSIHDLVYNV